MYLFFNLKKIACKYIINITKICLKDNNINIIKYKIKCNYEIINN